MRLKKYEPYFPNLAIHPPEIGITYLALYPATLLYSKT